MKHIVKDTAIYAVADFLFKFAGMAAFPFYARVLSVEEFGAISLLTTLAVLLSILCNGGQEQAIYRFFQDPETPEAKKTSVVSSGLLLSVGFSSGVLCVAFVLCNGALGKFPLIASLGWRETAAAIFWSFSLQIVNYTQATIRSSSHRWKFTLFSFLQNSLMISSTLYFTLVLQGGVLGYVGASAGASLASACLGLYFIRRHLQLQLNFSMIKEMFHYGFPLIFSGIAVWAFGSMDRWMLAEMTENYEVGIYSVAFKIGSVLTFLTYAFNGAWLPQAIKMTEQTAAFKQMCSRSLTVWFFLMILAGGGISLFGKELLMVMTPEEYWNAAPILPFVCLGQSIYATISVTSIGITITKRTKWITLICWIGCMMNFFWNLFLIPHFGASGAGTATFFSNLCMTLLYFGVSQKLYPIPWETSKLMVCSGMLALLFAASLYWSGQPWSPHETGVKAILYLAVALSGFALKDKRYNTLNYSGLKLN